MYNSLTNVLSLCILLGSKGVDTTSKSGTPIDWLGVQQNPVWLYLLGPYYFLRHFDF